MSRPRTAITRAFRIATASLAAIALTLTGSTAALAVTPTPAARATATITGTVSADADGSPVTGASIVLLNASGTEAASALTGEDGTFTASGLDAGTYTVSVDAEGFEPRFWPTADSAGQAEQVTVTQEEIRAGIDVTLIARSTAPVADARDASPNAAVPSVDAPLAMSDALLTSASIPTDAPTVAAATGSISGRVTRASDGAPVSNSPVMAQSTDGGAGLTTVTSASGEYSIASVPDGTYKVSFYPAYGTSLAMEWWDGAASYDDASPVTVVGGQHITHIDAAMRERGSISGRVVDHVSGQSVAQALVVASTGGSSWIARTGADGRYSLPVGWAGIYTVEFSAGGYAPQWWDGASSLESATPLTVAASTPTTSIDAALVKQATVAGHVGGPTLPSDPNSPWATMTAYQWGPDSAWHEATRVTGWGDYNFDDAGLPAGTYTVRFEAAGYCTQFFDGKGTLNEADRFTLSEGEAQTGVNAALSADCTLPTITPGTPTISGTTRVGDVLTAEPGSWAPAPIGLAYQWLADGAVIGGATDTTLTLSEAQLGTRISVLVTGSRPGYASVAVASPPVGPVASAAVKQMTPATPTVTGSTVAGSTLTADAGAWTPSDVTLSYQWYADAAAIPAATGTTFTPGAAEVGKEIHVAVTGSKLGYTSATADSAPVGPITAAPLQQMVPGTPVISGTAKVGQTLTAAPGTWLPSSTTFTYQWNADGVPVTGATGVTLLLDRSTFGATVTVTARGSAAGYESATATSAEVGPVAAGTLTVGQPTVEGTPVVGAPIIVSPGVWGPAPVALTYQWKVEGTPIEGAVNATFTPGADLVGKPLSMTVTGSSEGYEPAERTVSVGVVAPIVTLSTPATTPGATVTVTGHHFGANETVTLALNGRDLGTTTTDGAGTFAAPITLPADVTGDHHVVATGKDSGLSGRAAITITASAPGGDTGGAAGGSTGAGGLASTGSQLPLAALLIAITLIISGGALAMRRREAH